MNHYEDRCFYLISQWAIRQHCIYLDNERAKEKADEEEKMQVVPCNIKAFQVVFYGGSQLADYKLVYYSSSVEVDLRT